MFLLDVSSSRPGFYITRRVVFRTLGELVNHYKYDSDGLCLCLTEPCRNLELPQTADLSHNTKDQVCKREFLSFI